MKGLVPVVIRFEPCRACPGTPRVLLVMAVALLCLAARAARAATSARPTVSAPIQQKRLARHHYSWSAQVELERRATPASTPIRSSHFEDQDRAIAEGNVVITQGANRIAADRAEFNTKTRLGTFHNASGIANVSRSAAPRPGHRRRRRP